MNLKRIFVILMMILIGLITAVPLSYGLENRKEIYPRNLRLLGTILESDPAESFAVIQNLTTQQQGFYRTGDRISNYSVAKITRGRVFLLKDGKVLYLELPLGSMFEPIRVISPNERIVNRTEMMKKIANLNEAFQQAIAIPYIDSGKITGFIIKKIKDTTLVRKAGIKEGDIITKINGQSLNSLRKPWDIYHGIKDQEKIIVELKRGNEVKNLVYHIN